MYLGDTSSGNTNCCVELLHLLHFVAPVALLHSYIVKMEPKRYLGETSSGNTSLAFLFETLLPWLIDNVILHTNININFETLLKMCVIPDPNGLDTHSLFIHFLICLHEIKYSKRLFIGTESVRNKDAFLYYVNNRFWRSMWKISFLYPLTHILDLGSLI